MYSVSYVYSVDILMSHFRNQQLHARENRIPRSSPIERRTVAQSSTGKGLVFRFSFLVPSPDPATSSFAIRSLPRFSSSAHPRSQKLLRPQRNGHSVVPSGQVHAKKIRKKSSLLVSFQSLHPIHVTILFLFFFFFFQSAQVFGLCPVSLPFSLRAITFTCIPVESAALRYFRNLLHITVILAN